MVADRQANSANGLLRQHGQPAHSRFGVEGYAIEGPVAQDATGIAFGVMASGVVTADFEQIELAARAEDGSWIPVAIEDAGFEAGSDASGGWRRAGTSKKSRSLGRASVRPKADSFSACRRRPALRQPRRPLSCRRASCSIARHAPVPTSMSIFVSGLRARVSLALTEGEAVEDAKGSNALEAARCALQRSSLWRPARSGHTTRRRRRRVERVPSLLSVWTEARVEWDARLRPQLELAYDATTREAHRDALRLLVADLRDGHGSVVDPRGGGNRGALPVQFGVIEKQLVVTATAAPANAPVGAVVSSVDGVPATKRLADAIRLASGSAQWKETRALQEINSCSAGPAVKLVIDTGAGPNPTSLTCDAKHRRRRNVRHQSRN